MINSKYVATIVIALVMISSSLLIYQKNKYKALYLEHQETLERVSILKVQENISKNTIEIQNKAIEQIQIDNLEKIAKLELELSNINNRYLQALADVKTVEVVKYKTIPQKECAQTLEQIDKLFGVYYAQ